MMERCSFAGETGWSVDLLRHGEVEGGICFRGSLDQPLTKGGWDAMLETLSERGPWRRILTSPLIRCRHVAQTLATSYQLPLAVEEDFRELCFGAWEGKTAQQIMASDGDKLGAFWQDPENYLPPGGEPVTAFRQRVVRAWTRRMERVENHGQGDQLVIAHGGVIRIIVAELLGLPLSSALSLPCPLASLTRIHYRRWGGEVYPQLVAMGVT